MLMLAFSSKLYLFVLEEDQNSPNDSSLWFVARSLKIRFLGFAHSQSLRTFFDLLACAIGALRQQRSLRFGEFFCVTFLFRRPRYQIKSRPGLVKYG